MPTTTPALVVDTSVLIKWFKSAGEDLTDEAAELRDHIVRTRTVVCAPALLLYELGNILIRKSRLTPFAVADTLAQATEGLTVAPPDPPLLARAAEAARAHDLTFYDASFVALAAALGCRLVTADQQLADRAASLGFVVHLRDVRAAGLGATQPGA